MSNKIEHLEVNGLNLPISVFGNTMKELVASYEIARDERNKFVILARALDGYIGQTHTLRDEVAKNVTYAHALEAQMNAFEQAITAEVNRWVKEEGSTWIGVASSAPEAPDAVVDTSTSEPETQSG